VCGSPPLEALSHFCPSAQHKIPVSQKITGDTEAPGHGWGTPILELDTSHSDSSAFGFITLSLLIMGIDCIHQQPLPDSTIDSNGFLAAADEQRLSHATT
jgi:hypothetical protein